MLEPEVHGFGVRASRAVVLLKMVLAALEKPEVVVEPTVDGQVRRTSGPTVPFTHHSSAPVARSLELLRQRCHAEIDAGCGPCVVVGVILVDMDWEAARKQARSGWTTNDGESHGRKPCAKDAAQLTCRTCRHNVSRGGGQTLRAHPDLACASLCYQR